MDVRNVTAVGRTQFDEGVGYLASGELRKLLDERFG